NVRRLTLLIAKTQGGALKTVKMCLQRLVRRYLNSHHNGYLEQMGYYLEEHLVTLCEVRR
ncbi:MAG: hypothetical protein ABI970_16815, partial [Chloroflexota bacterium]